MSRRPVPVGVAVALAVAAAVLAAAAWPGGPVGLLVAAVGLAVVAGHSVSGSV
ncbi:hypothetical protein GCM10010123_26510 [Pilimelia anulata]|uniref:Uncharacterized protein n=1 Tax=Pilimelia anulata TaxID=53371 RepID=A0A8J3B5C8_9ACTN|nr:hypothetical protein [Pilimelia anulata]GGJ95414.1 hypothetical protein GCM10010123_26510 [Pilimelia anulata]